MQSSLHWSMKRASLSRLFIIEFTSCSLKRDKRTEAGKKERQRQRIPLKQGQTGEDGKKDMEMRIHRQSTQRMQRKVN